MLQQTQVDRVIPKYLAFLKAFPSINALASAKTGDVLTLWSGLGYNARAIRLQKTAQVITKDFKGKFPKDRDVLLTLPGVGPYTANAVLSFAFNLPFPCIDTNIRRILLHELQLPESTSITKLYSIAESLIPKNKSCIWHNALMDYGSSVLTAKKTGIKALTKQSKFLHSRRWYRGQIMKIVVKEKKISLNKLSKLLKKEKTFLVSILDELQKEKLVKVVKNQITLP
jgi:A/G-specific adenine glycosylase